MKEPLPLINHLYSHEHKWMNGQMVMITAAFRIMIGYLEPRSCARANHSDQIIHSWCQSAWTIFQHSTWTKVVFHFSAKRNPAEKSVQHEKPLKLRELLWAVTLNLFSKQLAISFQCAALLIWDEVQTTAAATVAALRWTYGRMLTVCHFRECTTSLNDPNLLEAKACCQSLEL